MASFVYYNWYNSHFQYCPSPYSLSLTIRNILLLTYNHSTVRKRDILPCQSPPVWLSSPSRSCWGAECRHRKAPPSADPGWRRWGGSQIPSLRLSTTEGVKENRRQHYMTLLESVWLDVTHSQRQLTGLPDAEDFTKDECELDAAPRKRTLVFVFPAAVFQDKLGKHSIVNSQS